MKVEQLVKRYQEINGEQNFYLRNLDDLLYVHEVDFKLIEGIETLTDVNRETFRIFLMNFYNAWGLTAKSTLVPLRIQLVLERWHCVDIIRKGEEDTVRVCIKEEHIVLDKRGKKLAKIREVIKEEYLSLMDQATKYDDIYLRFDYKQGDREEWVHVIEGGREWY